MAATYDGTPYVGGGGLPITGLKSYYTMDTTVNFATFCTNLKSAVDFVQNDVIQIFDIDALSQVVNSMVIIDTASDSADDVDFGYATSSLACYDSADLSAAADTTYLMTVASGFIVTSVDTLDIKFIGSSAVDDGIVRWQADIVDRKDRNP